MIRIFIWQNIWISVSHITRLKARASIDWFSVFFNHSCPAERPCGLFYSGPLFIGKRKQIKHLSRLIVLFIFFGLNSHLGSLCSVYAWVLQRLLSSVLMIFLTLFMLFIFLFFHKSRRALWENSQNGSLGPKNSPKMQIWSFCTFHENTLLLSDVQNRSFKVSTTAAAI